MREKEDNEIQKLLNRINELNGKATQILLFLSFAMVTIATLETSTKIIPKNSSWLNSLNDAFCWWKWALVPILANVLPIKELGHETVKWYLFVRNFKIILLWISILIIGAGIISFIKAGNIL